MHILTIYGWTQIHNSSCDSPFTAGRCKFCWESLVSTRNWPKSSYLNILYKLNTLNKKTKWVYLISESREDIYYGLKVPEYAFIKSISSQLTYPKLRTIKFFSNNFSPFPLPFSVDAVQLERWKKLTFFRKAHQHSRTCIALRASYNNQ